MYDMLQSCPKGLSYRKNITEQFPVIFLCNRKFQQNFLLHKKYHKCILKHIRGICYTLQYTLHPIALHPGDSTAHILRRPRNLPPDLSDSFGGFPFLRMGVIPSLPDY